MLSTYRILDLTDDRGHLAGLILAQLGADVVLIEPPGGQRTRHRGPYIGGVEDPNRSIEFHAFNRGKRSVVLQDIAELDQLAATADAVISCGAIDVDLDRLRAANPPLITAAITAFGGTGPKADWAATDLTIVAASGTMSITGDRDRPPVRIGPPQAWLHAAAVTIALHERRHSGLGRHIDTSTQQSFADCSQLQLMNALVGAKSHDRMPGAVQLGEFLVPWVYECADGHVTITFMFGEMLARFNDRLVGWMYDEGFADDAMRDTDWGDLGMAVFEGREPIETFDRAIEAVRAFALSKTKSELLMRALDDKMLIAPIVNTAEVLALDQLSERDYWQRISLPGGPQLINARFPGAIAKTTATALRNLAPTPDLDAHRIEVREDERRPHVRANRSATGTLAR